MVVVCLAASGCRAPEPPPLKAAFWYWHTPLNLSEAREQLQRMGVERVFVRTGTLTTDGDKVSIAFPQRFEDGKRETVHLVFNADAGVLHRLEEFSTEQLATTVVNAYNSARQAAAASGYTVEGIQLDIDYPTRLLPRYAELLREVRKRIPKDHQLSITGLTSWLSSPALKDVLDPLDFHAPQFYEAEVGRTVETSKPISSLSRLERGLQQAARFGKPFYVGAPTYGQTLLYDENGNLSGTYRGLSPDDALRHPSLQLEKRELVDGEELLRFRAVRPGRDGRGLGYYIVYRRLTPAAVDSFVETVRKKRPPTCKGILFFRIPEAEEAMAMPLPAVARVWQGGEPRPFAALRANVRLSPWEAIEGRGEISYDLSITVENTGDADTAVAPDAVEVVLRFPAGAVTEIQPGDFAAAEPFTGRPGSGRVGLARADGVVLRKPHLAPGERATLGPISLRGRGAVEGSWRIKPATGSGIEGRMDAVQFGEKSDGKR